MNNKELREANDEVIERAEIRRDKFVDMIGVFGPLAIPLVPAGLTLSSIGINYEKLLNFPWFASWPIGIISGIGIEVFGIIANENYLDMVRYNQTLQEGEEEAPVKEASEARDLYVKIVLGLLATLEVVPAVLEIIAHYAPSIEAGTKVISTVSVLSSLFPLAFLAILTARVIIMRKQHKQRVRKRMAATENASSESIIKELESNILELGTELESAESKLDKYKSVLERSDEVLAKKDIEIKKLEVEIEGLKRQLDFIERKSIQASTSVLEPVGSSNNQAKSSVPADKRRVEVLKVVVGTKQKSELNFSELARTFGTSDTTIKKDLDWLVKNDYWENHGEWKPTNKTNELIG